MMGVARTEDLGVDVIADHAPTSEPGSEVVQEGGRAAQVILGFAGHAQGL